MRRLTYFTALAAGLWLAGSAMAQPDRGPAPRPISPPRSGPDVRNLEAQLERLSARLDELEARLARAQRSDRPAPKDGGRGSSGFGRGIEGGWPGDRFGGSGGRGFGPERGPAPKDRSGFRGGPGQPGPDGFRGFGRGGPGGGPNPDVARRLDRIIDELEQLKKDLQAPKR
jgi:hypothetical protein